MFNIFDLLVDEDELSAELFRTISVAISVLSHLDASVIEENVNVGFLWSQESLHLTVKLSLVLLWMWLLDEDYPSPFHIVQAFYHCRLKLIISQILESIIGK